MPSSAILITGARGQLGQELAFVAKTLFPAFELILADRDEMDITHSEQVNAFFAQHQPAWCINCAAYTAVDKAESEAELAHAINATGAENLAKACQKHNTRLLHISTDYVYHAQQNTPFVETDAVSPQGVYARTKLQGDQAVLTHCEQAMVIRTSWVYGFYGHNFVKTMLRLGQERDHLRVVFDQIGSPTYTFHLAKAIFQLLEDTRQGSIALHNLKGVYHYSNEGVTSWYDFAVAIMRTANLECLVEPIRSSDYPTPAQRPPFSLLDKGKWKKTFSQTIPHWQEGLVHCLDRLHQSQ